MKNKQLKFDRSCHALYSKDCEKEIKKKIALHYSNDCLEKVWSDVQNQFVNYLSSWRTDLGGKKNFHNSVGGTYDCIALLSYYVTCKSMTSFNEIEEMTRNIVLPTFKKLKFVNLDKPLFKRLMYKAFCSAKHRCDK